MSCWWPRSCSAQVARLIAARRAKSAGSRLHLRLTGVFALMALIPTVTVAVFAGLTVNVGLEGWFSDRVRSVVGTSLAAAQAYEAEQRADLISDARTLARSIDNARNQGIVLSATANFLAKASARSSAACARLI